MTETQARKLNERIFLARTTSPLLHDMTFGIEYLDEAGDRGRIYTDTGDMVLVYVCEGEENLDVGYAPSIYGRIFRVN